MVEVRLLRAVCCLHKRQRMEHIWSQAVATSGNRWQIGTPRKRLNQAKTVAVGCDQLPIGAHGKERVDGSSPSEGYVKSLQTGRLRFCVTCIELIAHRKEPFMEPHIQRRLSQPPGRRSRGSISQLTEALPPAGSFRKAKGRPNL